MPKRAGLNTVIRLGGQVYPTIHFLAREVSSTSTETTPKRLSVFYVRFTAAPCKATTMTAEVAQVPGDTVNMTWSSGSSVQLTVVHRKQEHQLGPLPPSITLAELREAIEQATRVPTDKQKLLIPRSMGAADLNRDDDRTLDQVGLMRQGIKITVVGPLSSEVESLHAKEEAMHKSNLPRQYHPSLLKSTRACNTATPSVSPFGKLEAHATTPSSSPLHAKVIDYLTRLSTDAGILHICALHDFRIGTLTELLPWEHPELLGLNENMGQRISIRIRTDDAEGFRDYKTARRVLVHELAHNKVNDHPPEFKILNSKLNAQIEAFEAAQRHGRHTLVDGEFYQPAGADDMSASAIEERRQRILAATMKRLDKQDQEIEDSCGTTH